MTIVEKLAAIQDCKNDIKEAIVDKGGVISDSTPFNKYAEIIGSLPVGDGEPVEKVDYILTNSLLVSNDIDLSGGIPTNLPCPDIATLASYPIIFDEDKNTCTFTLVCEPEYPGYEDDDLKSIYWEFDIPDGYEIKTLYLYDPNSSTKFSVCSYPMDTNFRYENGKMNSIMGLNYTSYIQPNAGGLYGNGIEYYNIFRVEIKKVD